MMINSFRITSNRESGNGRYDVQMLPLTKHFPGFLIEIKAEKDCSEEQLEALAQTALQQINDRSYSAEMQALGIKSIIKGLSQILCKHWNAVQIEQNWFKVEVAQAAAALFSK